MNLFSVNAAAAVCDFRPVRKCFSISGSFLLMALLLVAQVSCRPSDETVYDSFQVGDEYADVDNVEWHHVKVVDGVLHEDHPVIMYKEDFVSEDYVPNKNDGSSSSKTQNTSKKYKDIAQHRRRFRPFNRTLEKEKYNALQPEKIYFDVLPAQPVVVADDSSIDDSKFDPKNIRVEVISLTEDDEKSVIDKKLTEEKEVKVSKELQQNKYPKKYVNSRKRRNAEDAHVVHKRNPYLVYPYNLNSYTNFITNEPPTPPRRTEFTFITYAVPGKKYNALEIEVPPVVNFQDRIIDPYEKERVVWDKKRSKNVNKVVDPIKPMRPTSQPPTRRPLPPIHHNSDPSQNDFSYAIDSIKPMRPTSQPPTRRPLPPIHHNSDPSQNDFSYATQSPRPPPTSSPSNKIFDEDTNTNDAVSKCVWGIVNCCSDRDNRIRYQCFEQLGCSGAFWGLNPCADNIRDNVIEKFISKNDDDY